MVTEEGLLLWAVKPTSFGSKWPGAEMPKYENIISSR
jgi:hypothetical protein